MFVFSLAGRKNNKKIDSWAASATRQELASYLRDRFGVVETCVLADSLCRKPHPEMIPHAAAAFGVSPGEVIYICDREVDRAAAESTGGQFLDARMWHAGALVCHTP